MTYNSPYRYWPAENGHCLYIFHPILEGQKLFLRSFFRKLLPLCMANNQEQVMMGAYGSFSFSEYLWRLFNWLVLKLHYCIYLWDIYAKVMFCIAKTLSKGLKSFLASSAWHRWLKEPTMMSERINLHLNFKCTRNQTLRVWI